MHLQSSVEPHTHVHYYRLALILGALTAVGPLAIDMYLPALPTIAREFGTAVSVVQSSLASYFIGIAIGQAFYGPLSDRIGRKPSLYLGLTLFMISSIGCARAESVNALVAFRFLQALGGCAPIVIPGMRNLWCMLNIVFFAETDVAKRALYYIDSVCLSGEF